MIVGTVTGVTIQSNLCAGRAQPGKYCTATSGRRNDESRSSGQMIVMKLRRPSPPKIPSDAAPDMTCPLCRWTTQTFPEFNIFPARPPRGDQISARPNEVIPVSRSAHHEPAGAARCMSIQVNRRTQKRIAASSTQKPAQPHKLPTAECYPNEMRSCPAKQFSVQGCVSAYNLKSCMKPPQTWRRESSEDHN